MMFVRHGPRWFRIATVLLVLWAIMGCVSCIRQVRMGADAMGSPTPYDRALFAGLPGWYDPVFAVAVGTGLIGAILLFRRRVAARPFFLASLLALAVQFGWLFASTDIITHKGAGTVLPFPAVILAIALFQIWVAGHARGRGWIG